MPGVVARARRARTRRGAALTEAAATIPVFLILMASMLYIFRLYAERANTRAEARHAVWGFALNACQEGPYTDPRVAREEATGEPSALDAVKAETSYPEQAGEPGPDGDKLIEDADADPGTDLGLEEKSGVASVTVQGATVLPNRQLRGALPHTAKTSMRVQCNERARSASAGDVLSFVWSLPDTLQLR